MIEIEEFTVEKARQADLVFLATTGSHALTNAPLITENGGPIVVDNSSAFRYFDHVPLVVPEVNGAVALEAIRTGRSRIIANPNCTTAIAAMALWPIHQAYGIEQLIMSTYQASSGQGVKGMAELKDGSLHQLTTGELPPNKIFLYPLPFNVIPQIDLFQENGYTKEEMKVVWETRKIFGLSEADIAVSCTAVRIPTLRAHSESITIKTKKPISPDDVRALLRTAPGVVVFDNVKESLYPMPLNSTGKDDVSVGRIRQSLVFGDHGLDLFVCGDQLLRGAALNAVLIAEHVLVNEK
jgi:aspartate-semialdehyde dehydrogenase